MPPAAPHCHFPEPCFACDGFSCTHSLSQVVSAASGQLVIYTAGKQLAKPGWWAESGVRKAEAEARLQRLEVEWQAEWRQVGSI